MGIFDPRWVKQIPAPLRPSKQQIKAIEGIRQAFGLRHEEITMFVSGHHFTTGKVLHHGCAAMKQQAPHLTEHQVRVAVLQQRVALSCTQIGMSSLLGLFPTSSEAAVAKVLSQFGSLEKLARAVTREEHAHSHFPTAPGYEAAEYQIDKVLRNS